jgi:hypothetical protein
MTGIVNILERLPDFYVARPALMRRGARAQITLLLGAGDVSRRLMLDKGTLKVADADGPMDGWDIALRGDASVWSDHWSAQPATDAADIFGMRRRGRLVIEGNFLPLMRNLQVIKDILALPRGML